MRSVSIAVRTLISLNVLAALVGLCVGWIGIAVCSRALERQFVETAAANAAELIGEMRLPLSPRLMSQLSRVFGASVLAVRAGDGGMIASSLPDEDAAALAVLLARESVATLCYHGNIFRVGRARLSPGWGGTGGNVPACLYVLASDSTRRQATGTAGRKIALATAVSLIVATLLATWMARGLSAPLAALTGRMEALSEAARRCDWLDGESDGETAPGSLGAMTLSGNEEGLPREHQRLLRAFAQLLEDLRETRVRLAASARFAAVGKLAASVAHEIRNPLSGIKLNAQVLAEEWRRRGVNDESLDFIVREIDRLNIYLEELLGIARGSAMELGQAAVPGGQASVADAVESVVALLSNRARRSGIALVSDIATGLKVAFPEENLRQILLNLLLNALEATPNGGRVTISAEKSDARVRVLVCDTGPGVRIDNGVDVFAPFSTTKPNGFGLGLAICRRLAEAHGAELDFVNTGDGACFRLDVGIVTSDG